MKSTSVSALIWYLTRKAVNLQRKPPFPTAGARLISLESVSEMLDRLPLMVATIIFLDNGSLLSFESCCFGYYGYMRGRTTSRQLSVAAFTTVISRTRQDTEWARRPCSKTDVGILPMFWQYTYGVPFSTVNNQLLLYRHQSLLFLVRLAWTSQHRRQASLW